MTTDPLHPSPALLAKLGSLIVHAKEAGSKDGHVFDLNAAQGLLDDPEVKEWMQAMRDLAMLPEKRSGK